MIKTPTVFILGAGASCPYGYPTSAGLTKNICDKVLTAYGNDRLFEMNFSGVSGTEFELFKEIAENLRQLSTVSIDRFLEINPKFQKAGKMLIAHEILSREGASAAVAEDDWYAELWTEYMLTTRIDDIPSNRVTFVTFNYDRSLEHFLFQKLKSTFRSESEAKIAAIANTIEIVHVHGQVGFLPWQNNGKQGHVRDYVAEGSWHVAKVFSEQIKIVSEMESFPVNYGRACQMMYAAEHVYFLGFGYHEENLKRLRSRAPEMKLKNVRGSSFQLPRRDMMYLESDKNPLGQTIFLGDSSDTALPYLRRSVLRD